MGKYSLENYCSYETYKIRPRSWKHTPDLTGRGTYELMEYTWEELEPEQGRYCMEHMTRELRQSKNIVLKITKETPAWLHTHGLVQEGFAHLLRRVASVITQQHHIVGVMITSNLENKREVDAYIDAFTPLALLVRIEEEALITYLKGKRSDFGLMVSCSEDNWIECCEYFAKQGLQHTWERSPVILEIRDLEPGTVIRRESIRWHASYANLPLEIGYSYTLRRLTYPKKIIGGGGLPLRFWFVNTGSAPCYQDFSLKLRLTHGSVVHEFQLSIDTRKWLPGDIVHNEIISLPELADGTYQVSIGLVRSDGASIPLSIEARQEEGFYELGGIEVVSVLEDDLLHAWDDFYPDGYYPLEDPQAPKES